MKNNRTKALSPIELEDMAMEKRYWKAVDKLSDDTGYFDHEFVLKFIRKELKRAKSEAKIALDK